MREKILAGVKSFERIRKFDVPHAVRAMYDVMDNAPWYGTPRASQIESRAEYFDAVRDNTLQTFIPEHFSSDVVDQFAEYGEMHHHEVPGRKEDSTKHGHRFIVNVDDASVRLLFLDPEHMVGRRNLLRPAVCNLLALTVLKESREIDSFAFQRVRTAAVPDEQLDFVSLQRFTSDMIENDNLSLTEQSADIVFRVSVDSEHVQVQSRYVGPKGIEAPLCGDMLPRFIQGKADTMQLIFKKFLSIQAENGFIKRNTPVSIDADYSAN